MKLVVKQGNITEDSRREAKLRTKAGAGHAGYGAAGRHEGLGPRRKRGQGCHPMRLLGKRSAPRGTDQQAPSK